MVLGLLRRSGGVDQAALIRQRGSEAESFSSVTEQRVKRRPI